MQNHVHLQITPLGDTALRIQLGAEISQEINQQIRSLAFLLSQEDIKGVIEWIPTYTAVTIIYNPYVITYKELKKNILEIFKKQGDIDLPSSELIYIPTLYGGEVGPDIKEVAAHNELSVEEVIDIHSSSTYLIYMMGFTPGFPYLGGMSKLIATPRLQTPRQRIPSGSVGIADKQTGIYPMESPGGWQIIGRTPLRLYEPKNEKPMLLQAGHCIKFVPVSRKEYELISADVEAGTYHVEKEKMS